MWLFVFGFVYQPWSQTLTSSLIDIILQVRIDDERPSVFTWNLATVYSAAANEADMIRSPVMRGDVFAIRKNFLDQVGGFDEHLKQARGSAYHVELSFRWMCTLNDELRYKAL